VAYILDLQDMEAESGLTPGGKKGGKSTLSLLLC